MEDVILWRSLERILAVLAGAVSIYLGYRLFLIIPHETGGKAKIEFQGKLSVYVARVGPGVFFCAVWCDDNFYFFV